MESEIQHKNICLHQNEKKIGKGKKENEKEIGTKNTMVAP